MGLWQKKELIEKKNHDFLTGKKGKFVVRLLIVPQAIRFGNAEDK